MEKYKRTLDMKEKVLFLFMIIAIFLAMFVPVYQASQMRALETQLVVAEAKLVSINEQTKEIEANLSAKLTFNNSSNNFNKVNFNDAKVVSIR